MGENQTKPTDTCSLTRIMDDMLLNTRFSPQTPTQFFQSFAQRASIEHLTWDEDLIINHWSWLQQVGAIVLTGISGTIQYCPTGTKPVAGFYVTSRSRTLLERGDVSPHNPERFYTKIRSKVASTDEVVMTYLDEGVGAWATGLNRAAVVMIGCACEKLILLLAKSISETGISPWSDDLTQYLERENKPPVSISSIFKKVREALLSLTREKKLPSRLVDALDRKLTPIFEHTRALRNMAGHPTADLISSDDAEATILLFPGLYFFTDELIKALEDLRNN